MIDPELQYCPRCGDEYLQRVTHCAACALELVSGREILRQKEQRESMIRSKPLVIQEGEDVVTIYRGNLGDLRFLQAMLAGLGVGALVVDDGQGCGGSCGPPTFNLQVRREQAAEAMAVVDREYRKSTALEHHDESLCGAVFDTDQEEASCPACGHRFSTVERTCPDCGLCFG